VDDEEVGEDEKADLNDIDNENTFVILPFLREEKGVETYTGLLFRLFSLL
jgi:hypothetical protein